MTPQFLTGGRVPDRLHAVAGAQPGRGHGTLAAPSSPPSARLLTGLSAPGTEGQVPRGRGLAAREPGPLALRSHASPGSSLPGEHGGVHALGQVKKER